MRLDPKYPYLYINLGNALKDKGDLDGAIAEYREAIRLYPQWAIAHYNLGLFLQRKGDLDGAEREIREAVRLDGDHHGAAIDALAALLVSRGNRDGAIAPYKELLRLAPKSASAHNGLGWTLQQTGDLDGAIAKYKEALRLEPKHKNAVVNLPWAERLRELLARLPGVLAGTDRPAPPAEALSFAALCYLPFQRRYAAAVRLSEEAFAADPGAGDGLSLMFPDENTNRYDEARSATLAGGGAGVDAPSDAAARAALRAKALAWLRSDLGLRQKQAASAKPDDRRKAADVLDHWLTDTDLAGVRDPEPLAKLPTTEREAWQKFWTDVKATLAEAKKPVPPAKTDAGKK
jgi:tetratricopeptide (TPR) repeat protein